MPFPWSRRKPEPVKKVQVNGKKVILREKRIEDAADDAQPGASACSGTDRGDADLGILRADAEDATTAVANDVDLDFVSADAELEER